MSTEYFANNATSALSGSITSGSPTLTIFDPVRFPATAQFRLLVNSEYMLVTGVTGSVYSITRGIEGSIASGHVSGAVVSHVLTSGGLLALGPRVSPFFLANEIVLSNLTWVNQGTATATQDNLGIGIRGPTSTANLRCLVRALNPTTGYVFTVPVWYLGFGGVVSCGGILLRDSSGTKLTTIALLENGTTEIQKWNSPTSFSALYTSVAASTQSWKNYGKPIYLQIEDDGTTRFYRIGADGFMYYTIFSVSRTDFLTPDQYGYFTNVEGSTGDNLATFYSTTMS